MKNGIGRHGMTLILPQSWKGLHSPLLNPAPIEQMAALCWRKSRGEIEVLLVTSSNGRWILPKGWPIKGQTGAQTALQEAWEEAGVKRAKAQAKALGRYDGIKRLDNGVEIPCRISVYAIKVEKTVKSYPEDALRKRRWVDIEKAISLIGEPGLKILLASFAP